MPISPEDELLQVILQARSVEYAYRLNLWADQPLKLLLTSLRQAQNEILTYLDNVGAGLTEWSEARSLAMLDHFQDLTLGVRSALGQGITEIATLVGANALLMHSDILSFGNRIELFNNVSMTAAQLKSFIIDTKLGGKVMQEWVDSVYSFNIQEQIRQELFTGALKGESYPELVDRIRQGFGIAEKDAINLARTYVQSANVGAQEAVFNDNKDIIEGIKWVATLETSFKKSGRGTCLRCIGLDGQVWKLDEEHPEIPLHWRCFISPKVPIYTSKGWKPIADIKVGDLVMTHKKRFRKVTELIFTPRQKPKVIKIFVKSCDDSIKYKIKSLSLTEDHPVLVNGKWISANNIQIGDKVSYLGNRCDYCNSLIPWDKKFCGKSCRFSFLEDPNNNPMIGRTHSEETKNNWSILRKGNPNMMGENNPSYGSEKPHLTALNKSRIGIPISESAKEKQSNSMKEWWDSEEGELQKQITSELSKAWAKDHPEEKLKAAKKGHASCPKISSLEIKLQKELDRVSIDYIPQYEYKLGFVDLFISPNICVFVDGKYWHGSDEAKIKDAIQTKFLEDNGYLVVRFGEDSILRDIEKCSLELSRILANHNGNYEFIDMEVVQVERRNIPRPRTLYNFSVEEDESYIANGFVVHNCRCCWVAVTIPWRKLGIDIDEISSAFRPWTYRPEINIGTGRKGKIIDHGFHQGDYSSWLATQSDRFQKNVLGPRRFELYDAKLVNLKDMVNQQTGKLIRIKDLKF